MFSEPSSNCSRMKSCEWSTVTGSIIHAAGPATTNARSPNFVLVRWTTRSPPADDPSATFNAGLLAEFVEIYRRRSVHRFVQHQIQFEPDALWHRQPMQPIANQAGDMWVFSYTKQHPRRGIHHALQTTKSILRHTREEAVAIVNPADYKAVDQELGRVERNRTKRALDPSELVEAAANNMIDMWKKA